ncbi:ArsR family transcriptional regulator (plasmid) [Deinococcus sp. KNUC1210]|uniref:ArsR family transcriptional regulator n=1 Tax=Deinococcus sp. KNUC1210 TaxID=2917691 RepID=UPI001EF0E002|nr:ArsR family transcriptional regulator [Deinococcus sp. KNUC1210]ULH18135.1 ArsR family transcriptional regulator [Deinococcus sp. KNUC1210]
MTVHQVASAGQATLLLRPELRPLLQYLMQEARSAGEVARELKVPLARASYLLRKLQRGEIAVVERVEARSGRPVKRYRVFPTWFIPYEVTAAETLESFWAAQLVPRMNEVAGFAARQLQEHHPIWGFWLSQGEVYSNLEVGNRRGPARDLLEGDEPLMLTIAALRLAEPQARILKRRLLALLTEASTWDTGSATEYTLSLILVRGSVE